MADSMYLEGKAAFGEGEIDYINDPIMAQLLDLNAYTRNMDTDKFLSVIPAGARVGAPFALTGKTMERNVTDHKIHYHSDAVVLTGVTGAESEAIALYKDNVSDATRRLICLYDTATGVPGLPLTPQGSPITITPHANGWFAQ